MKRSIYKIMGATGIIAILLLGSIVVAGPAAKSPSIKVSQELEIQAQQPQQQPQQQYPEYEIATYDDEAYPLYGYPDETVPYPESTPVFGPDLCTVIIARFRGLSGKAHIFVRVRNIGISSSSGANAVVRVWSYLSLEWRPIFTEEHNVPSLGVLQADGFATAGGVHLNQPIHMVTVKLWPNTIGEEGFGLRAINLRIGFVTRLLGPQ